jgi:fumarylacetoacetate (FAA) hydrolase family protein
MRLTLNSPPSPTEPGTTPAPLNPRKPEAPSSAALETIKLLDATLLQSAVVELSRAAQNGTQQDQLKHLLQEFEATLTDSQRQLLASEGLSAVKMLDATLLQSAVVELSRAAQNGTKPDQLKHLLQEFEATLTDSQRQLLASGGLSAVKLLEATFLQSAVVELSRAAQDGTKPDDPKHLHQEFEATLTDSQRQLIASGGLSAELLTPGQIEILRKMEPYLQGLTPEQIRLLGLQDGIREAQEISRREHVAGQGAAKQAIMPYAAGILLLVVVALILVMLKAC